jgi:hypothetical protein
MNDLEDFTVLGHPVRIAWDRDSTSLQVWRNMIQDKEARDKILVLIGPRTPRLTQRILTHIFSAKRDYEWREQLAKDTNGYLTNGRFFSINPMGGWPAFTGMNVNPIRAVDGINRVITLPNPDQKDSALKKFWDLIRGK